MKSVLTIVLFYLINFPLWDFLVAKSMPEEWASFTVYSLLFVIVLALNFKSLQEKFRELSVNTKNKFGFLLKLLAIIVISYVAMTLLVLIFDKVFNISILPQNTENLKSNSEKMPKIITFVMMTIFAPIIEEYVFRESFIAWVDKDKKVLLATVTVISVIMFDLIHVINFFEFFYYIPLSVSLTYVYWDNERNVSSSIIMHSLTNALGFVMMLIGQL